MILRKQSIIQLQLVLKYYNEQQNNNNHPLRNCWLTAVLPASANSEKYYKEENYEQRHLLVMPSTRHKTKLERHNCAGETEKKVCERKRKRTSL